MLPPGSVLVAVIRSLRRTTSGSAVERRRTNVASPVDPATASARKIRPRPWAVGAITSVANNSTRQPPQVETVTRSSVAAVITGGRRPPWTSASSCAGAVLATPIGAMSMPSPLVTPQIALRRKVLP